MNPSSLMADAPQDDTGAAGSPNPADHETRKSIWINFANWLQSLIPPRDGDLNKKKIVQFSSYLREDFRPDHAALNLAQHFSLQIKFLTSSEIRPSNRQTRYFFWDANGLPFQIVARQPFQKIGFIGFTGDESSGVTYLPLKKLKKLARGFFSLNLAQDRQSRYFERTTTRKATWLTSGIRYMAQRMPIIMLAALTANICALGASLFALQVWDRVIPSQSTHTLTILTIGVLFAILVDFTLRVLRARIIDGAGMDVSTAMSKSVYDKFLDMRSDARPKSVGSMVNQLRELEHFRDIFGSSVLTAVIDLFFLVLFVFVVYVIGGYLVIPLLAGIVLTVAALILFQLPLNRLAKENLKETTIKSALIVEAATYGDQIKGIGATENFKNTWYDVVVKTSTTSRDLRTWKGLLTLACQNIQQLSYVMLVVMGAVGVVNSELTMGQVIACSILLNRALAPLMQLSGVASSLQSALIGKRSIDDFMAKPEETDASANRVDTIEQPSLQLNSLEYSYPGTTSPQLSIRNLEIAHGSKIGLIGKAGSGKSTLLRILANISEPSKGNYRISGVDAASIPSRDLRRLITFVPQNPRLFRGSVRENLLLGYPEASEQDIVAACSIVGAESWLLRNKDGLEHPISETGEGFSGGQIQAIALARGLIRPSTVFLLDEPSAHMDEGSERAFIQRLRDHMEDNTLIIATHRPAPLSMCDRIIVLDGGRVVLDGPSEKVLKRVRGPIV